MSIIHDALKKVQESSGVTAKQPAYEEKPRGAGKRLLVLLFILGVCSSAFILSQWKVKKTQVASKIAIEPQKAPLQPSPPAPPVTAEAVPQPQPKKELPLQLVLSGVFFTREQGFALINNRIVKEGDKVEGLMVRRIRLNEVELEKEGQTTTLEVPAR